MSGLSIEHGAAKDLIRDAQHVRRLVFIEGQNVPEERELDGLDNESQHYVGYIDRTPVAVARTRHVNMNRTEYGCYDLKIERVGVLPVYRGHGLGMEIMRFILAQLPEQPNIRNAVLESQVHALGFYQELGFTATGPVFEDAGIPHRKMYKPVS